MLLPWAKRTLIKMEKTMVNPVSVSSDRLVSLINDSLKHRDPPQDKDGSSPTNVSLSEKAQELKMSESDNPLVGVLKKEFNEVFKFGGDKKDSFLKKLDQIFVNNRL